MHSARLQERKLRRKDHRTAVKISVRKSLMATNFSVHRFSWLEGLMLYPA